MAEAGGVNRDKTTQAHDTDKRGQPQAANAMEKDTAVIPATDPNGGHRSGRGARSEARCF